MFWNYHPLLSTLTEPNLRNSPFQTNHLNINYTLICRSNEAALLMNEGLIEKLNFFPFLQYKYRTSRCCLQKSLYHKFTHDIIF